MAPKANTDTATNKNSGAKGGNSTDGMMVDIAMKEGLNLSTLRISPAIRGLPMMILATIIMNLQKWSASMART